jgi:signal transduction histidine kinase
MMDENLLNTLENGRRYIARELHDTLAQTTQQLSLQAGLCRKLLERGQADMLALELAGLEQRAQLASTQVRELIADMRPPELEPGASLRQAVEAVIAMHRERGGPPVEFSFEWAEPELFDLELPRLALLRLCQEALLNVRKHAAAERALLALTEDEEHRYLTLSDDGHGFDALELEARSIDRGGAGLANMQARARATGGVFSVGRNILGRGAKISITWPK